MSADTKPTKSVPKAGTLRRARYELKDKFDDQLLEVSKGSDGILGVDLKAEDNLSSGLMRIGIKNDAKDAFRQVFKDAKYSQLKEVVVVFHMTLINKATGKESDGNVAIYSMKRAEAKEVVWANQDSIDWDAYRDFVHPALN